MRKVLRLPSCAVVGAVLALSACAQMQAPQSMGVPPGGPNDPVPASYLRGTEFDKPTMMHYSWGILDVPPPPDSGPQIQYTWSDVRRRLAAANRR